MNTIWGWMEWKSDYKVRRLLSKLWLYYSTTFRVQRDVTYSIKLSGWQTYLNTKWWTVSLFRDESHLSEELAAVLLLFICLHPLSSISCLFLSSGFFVCHAWPLLFFFSAVVDCVCCLSESDVAEVEKFTAWVLLLMNAWTFKKD